MATTSSLPLPLVAASPFSRRTFLSASAGMAATGLLVACGDDGGNASGGYKALQYFPDGNQAADIEQRFPFGLGDEGGVVENVGSGGPGDMVATIRDSKGAVVAKDVAVKRHNKDLARPYWPLFTKLPVGVYEVTFTLDGTNLEGANVSVAPKEAVAVPVPGTAMPALDTPTTTDTKDVKPICTRQPACPFHAQSYAEALAKGPVALLVGTPAYCQTGICGPVLDLLMTASSKHTGIGYVHAEVFTDDTLKTPTATVQALKLTFEPSLFLVRADGTLAQRIDVIYDADELDAALTALTA